ncbi:hypothetical protein J3Q64DRAFT_1009730 [Phycomyces blakesleeanus]|uniref:Uncharacterized protein n=1 Tax=Phycomyces blakesleeanus TaxID=4837 RepID=A0ABR3BCK9_PHYBL
MATYYSPSQIPSTVTLDDSGIGATTTSTEDELLSSSPSRSRTLRRKPNMDVATPLARNVSRTRPNFSAVQSSDASRFMTLDSLPFRSLMPSKSRDLLASKQDYISGGSLRQLTVETAVFPDPPIFHTNEARRVTSQGDVKSIKSGNESIRSQKKKRRPIASSYITPTEIFAQNLSDAVLDVDDSDEHEGYVYRDKTSQASFYPPPWSNVDSDHPQSFHGPSSFYSTLPPHNRYSTPSTAAGSVVGAATDHMNPGGGGGGGGGTEGSDYYAREKPSYSSFYNYNYNSDQQQPQQQHNQQYQKQSRHSPRRPVLRSAVSELPTTGGHPYTLSSLQKKPRYQRQDYWYPSDDENRPLVNRAYGKKRRKPSGKNKGMILLWIFLGCMAGTGAIWLFLIFVASPLTEVEVVGISNVLGTQKELIFNLQVRARNYNWWTVQISHASFSVFASSHFVPTIASMNQTNDSPLESSESSLVGIDPQGADPAEFLGTIYQLEDPLVFEPGKIFHSTQSTAISQIQIKNPGATHGDNRGNERWSLLIRYPYELTVRGVLKYSLMSLPGVTQLHSARVCNVSSIDPATGKISDVPLPERTICDDPSPVEGV